MVVVREGGRVDVAEIAAQLRTGTVIGGVRNVCLLVGVFGMWISDLLIELIFMLFMVMVW